MSGRSRRPPSAKRVAPPPDDNSPSQGIAHGIISKYNDLEPSVNRIMTADLDEVGCLHAITLFRESLTAPGDPHRDPLKAIDAARAAADPKLDSDRSPVSANLSANLGSRASSVGRRS